MLQTGIGCSSLAQKEIEDLRNQMETLKAVLTKQDKEIEKLKDENRKLKRKKWFQRKSRRSNKVR